MAPVAFPATRRAAVVGYAVERVRAAAPEGIEVVAIDDRIDLESFDFLIPSSRERRVLEALPGLPRVEVVQTLSAGTDWVEDRLPSGATLCNARGARDGPVAQWIVAALLGTTSRTLECAQLTTWTDEEIEDLDAWTVLIVGMGSIGREVARLLEPIGPRVVGVASKARDDLRGVDELPGLLPEADAVVLLTPLTDSTEGLIGGAELRAMADGALLVNAARGAVVDTRRAPRRGHHRQAPRRPRRHRSRAAAGRSPPLVRARVLAITPHIAGDSPLGEGRAIDLAIRNLTRWAHGEELENVVRRPAT